ncbi:hypothetical protein J2795_002250 [Chryseobacterium bernardetii]|uniref:C1q domain-containing protein n=2 Tax=Chryseobacterium TaxID=59732 RepID=A0A543EFZ7_9FLAO|nr:MULTISPECIES: hypothetical protein [Chryseobacterium]MDR6370538.1 hypothetical protein [Chryseobacterium vietnamense]MDR6441544.1 hypothetical protein [Chryseobacterium bernardetii]TQM20498.1 hypothetical protein FB551_0168 [Chryseobacterium aquifrigidense]
MKIKNLYSLITVFTATAITYAQVGINTVTPQATLDVAGNTSTTMKDGILPPRVSKQQLASKDAGTYGSAQAGALVYITDTTAPSGTTPSLSQVADISNNGYYYFTGSAWVPFSVNLYNADGILSGNRVVTQDASTLAFTSTSTNGFSVDGATFSVDAANDRVGLGTASPEARFHVVSTVPTLNRYNLIDATAGTNQYGIMALRNTSALATGNYSLLGFTNSGPASGGANWALGSIRTGSTLTNGSEEDFYIGNSTGGGLIERMRINPTTGNVGIGTSSASNKLHINATNPVRLEGLQAASGTSGSLTVNSTGVVQLKNSASISAARGTGIVTITTNNTFVNTSVSAKTFDNLSEMAGNTFIASSTGLYKVDFIVNYPQRGATEDGGDGYLGYAQISLNGIQQSFTNTKVTLPEASGAPSFVSCTNSTLIKMNAGQVLSFQALSFGSTPNTTNIVAPFTINVVRID